MRTQSGFFEEKNKEISFSDEACPDFCLTHETFRIKQFFGNRILFFLVYKFYLYTFDN